MRKLKWIGYQILCDRCGEVIDPPRTWLCEKCYETAPESVRPRDLRFAGSKGVCSICGLPDDAGANKDVCDRCASKHPDSSHDAFGRSEDTIFSHCSRCHGLQIMERAGGADRFTYYRTGSKRSTSEAYICPGTADLSAEAAGSECTHEWLMVRSLPPETGEPLEHNAARLFLSEELMDFVRQQIKAGSATFWCWKCGGIRHVTGADAGAGGDLRA